MQRYYDDRALPQPFEQLAKTLELAGEARAILFAAKDHARVATNTRITEKALLLSYVRM